MLIYFCFDFALFLTFVYGVRLCFHVFLGVFVLWWRLYFSAWSFLLFLWLCP